MIGVSSLNDSSATKGSVDSMSLIMALMGLSVEEVVVDDLSAFFDGLFDDVLLVVFEDDTTVDPVDDKLTSPQQ
jgi:hypothetical protein